VVFEKDLSPRSVRVVARPRGAADRPIRPPQLIAPSRPGWPRLLDRGDQSLASYPRDTRRGEAKRRSRLFEIFIMVDVLRKPDGNKPGMMPAVIARRKSLPEHDSDLVRLRMLLIM